MVEAGQRLNIAWHPWPTNRLMYALLDSTGTGFVISAVSHTILCSWNGVDILAGLRNQMRQVHVFLPQRVESWLHLTWSHEGYRLAVTGTNCVAILSFIKDPAENVETPAGSGMTDKVFLNDMD